MKRFSVIRVKDLDHMDSLLKEDIVNPYFLSGGTDLIIRIKENHLKEPFTVIDISGLEELKGITVKDDHIIAGALVTHGDVMKHPKFQECASVLVQACGTVGSPQIRNRGTIGGNIANSSPAGDSLPPLYILGAEVHLARGKEDRWVKIEDFIKGPGKNVLNHLELIKEVRIPLLYGYEGKYMKLGQRKALAISKVSLAINIYNEEKILKDVRIALGAVGPVIIRAKKTEEFLKGKELNENIIEEAVKLIKEEAKPISDLRSTDEYRRDMTGVLLKKFLSGEK